MAGGTDGNPFSYVNQGTFLSLSFLSSFCGLLIRLGYGSGSCLCMYRIQIRLSSSSPPHTQYHSLACLFPMNSCRLLPGILGSSPSTHPRPQKNFYSFFLIKFLIRRRALIDKSNEDNQILKSLTFIWKVRVTAPVSLLSIVSLFETLFSCAVQPLPTIIGVNLDACKNVEPGFCQKSPRAAFQDGAAQPDG